MSEDKNRGLVLSDETTSPQDDLEFTSKVRRAVLGEILSDKDNTTDPKVGKLMISLLDGIDRQVFNRRRADAADAMSKGIGDIAGALDKLVIQGGVGFSRPPEDDEDVELREVEVPDLPDIPLSEGTLDPIGSAVDVVQLMNDEVARRRRESEAEE